MGIEIKKRRETEWIIQFKNSPNKIIFKSIEESDRVISIEIGLSNDKNSLRIQISPEEFIRFYEIVRNFNSSIKEHNLEEDISDGNIKEDVDSSSPPSLQQINRNEDFDKDYSVDAGSHKIEKENNEEVDNEDINNEWSDWN